MPSLRQQRIEPLLRRDSWGMKEALALAVYGGLMRLLSPLLLLKLWWRGRREPGYRLDWAARWGWTRAGYEPGSLWLHAVSLGETRAASALVAELRRQRPGLRLLLTHGTATGREAGQALLHPGDRQTWLPFDTPGATQRFFQAQRPAVGVLMETEVWPQLLKAASRAGVPMVLANARLSAKSARQGQRLAPLLHAAGQRLKLVLAQTEADAQRLRQAGPTDVRLTGNLKYDLVPPQALLNQGQAWRAGLGRAVVVAANTREGEEAELLSAWSALPKPRPLLLLVPRHPQRFDAVAQGVLERGLSLKRRSNWADAPPADAAAVDVWLGDSLGELALYYAMADVALLGGSFQPLGGHNLIESCACGCPIVLGPSTFNFAEAATGAVQAGAAWQVADWSAALAQAQRVWANPALRKEASTRALAFTAQHKGAAARMAAAILALMPSDSPIH